MAETGGLGERAGTFRPTCARQTLQEHIRAKCTRFAPDKDFDHELFYGRHTMKDVLAVLLLFFQGVFNARNEQMKLEARIDYLEAQLELAQNVDRDNTDRIYVNAGKLAPLLKRLKYLEERIEDLDPTHRFNATGSRK